jgi:hypothetical protein
LPKKQETIYIYITYHIDAVIKTCSSFHARIKIVTSFALHNLLSLLQLLIKKSSIDLSMQYFTLHIQENKLNLAKALIWSELEHEI